MQCVILAGGLGTRMRQLTGDTPKTLLPVGGFPFAFYQLDWLAQHGVTDVVYSIGFQGHLIQEYVGDGSRWGLREFLGVSSRSPASLEHLSRAVRR